MLRLKINSIPQNGLALIVLVFIVGLAAAAFLLYQLNANMVKIERDKKTAAALAEAKVALIGRSVTDSNRPGSLPCPDTNGDGSAELFSGNACPLYLGRFPWRTLGTERLEDGYGETLWYALSSNYRDHSSAEPINGTVSGLLNVNGAGDIVAIIFSPGPPLSAQTGRPSNNVIDYLEGENSNGDNNYSSVQSQVQNDTLRFISRMDLFSAVAFRILGEVRGNGTQGLRMYYADNSNKFPYAATINNGDQGSPPPLPLTPYLPYNDLSFDAVPAIDAMLSANHWLPLVGYQVAANQKSATITLNGKTMGVTP